MIQIIWISRELRIYPKNTYMLSAGLGLVRIVKISDRGLSILLYGPTLSRPITFFFSPVVNCLFTQRCH